MSSLFAAQGRLSGAGIGSKWGRLAALGLLATVSAVAYLPTTLSLLAEWNDTEAHTYTHGFLVLGVSLWLVLRDRGALSQLPVRPMRVVLPLLFVVGVASIVVQRAGIEIGHQLLLPLMAWLSIVAAFGWGFARLCAFPLGYLYFAVPVWTHVNDQLQYLTVAAVQVLLRASGIPAYFEGSAVEIPSGLFQIEDGCSGLHFLIVALSLAALLGELQGDRPMTRLRHLALGGLFAIVANWLRVYIIIVAGHLTNMQSYLVRVDHYYFGWLVFAVAMAAFLAVSRARATQVDAPRVPDVAVAAAGTRSLVSGLLASIVVLALPPAISTALGNGQSPMATLPDQPWKIEGWTGPLPSAGDWKPSFVGADQESASAYIAGDRRLELYVASYHTQRQGKELIGYRNSFVSPMRELSVNRIELPQAAVNEHLVVDGRGQKWLVWSFYTVGSRAFASGVASELWYGLVSLTGPIESKAVAIRIECSADCASVRDGLGRILEQSSLHPGLGSHETSR